MNQSKRPFFSIIIPCYNDGRYKEGVYLDRLLNSICSQFLPREDVEVVLADDCSPVSFKDTYVDKYSGFLTMKYVKTDYNFAPGNTREKGVSVATGKWLAFADHDDAYMPLVLGKVKEAIEKDESMTYLITDFNEVRTNGSVKKEFRNTYNWCHGKFYNFDRLWKAENIHFIKDLKSHEDIAICSQVMSIVNKENSGHKINYLPLVTYLWSENPQSLSHITYIDKDFGDGIPHTFLETHFKDYIDSTGYITLDKYTNGLTSEKYARRACLEVLCYCYFYMQGFQFQSGKNTLKVNFEYARDYYNRFVSTFDLTKNDVLTLVSNNNAEVYWKIRRHSEIATGPRMDTQTFKQWLDIIAGVR